MSTSEDSQSGENYSLWMTVLGIERKLRVNFSAKELTSTLEISGRSLLVSISALTKRLTLSKSVISADMEATELRLTLEEVTWL